MTKLETVAAAVVANGESLKTADDFGMMWLGIKEVCLAIERQMGCECDIAEIHAALLKVANLSPRDDPQARRWIEAQWPFGWDPRTGNPSDRRLVVNKRS